MFDYLIIGGGIGGLFLALLLSQKYPQAKIALFEKNNYLGGRVKVARFSGRDVVVGAGVGNYEKDFLLKALNERYNLPLKTFVQDIKYNFEPLDNLAYLEDMKTRELDRSKSFKENFIRLYGKDIYQRFLWTNGYSDFEKADVIDSIYDYGFDDNVCNYTEFRVDWRGLIQNLVDEVKRNGVTIRKNIPITKVIKRADDFEIQTSTGKRYYSKKVIYATNIKGLSSYQNPGFQRLIKQIKCQPFLRLYIKTDQKINQIEGFTFLNNFLQKAIDMGNNIYMISYSDNKLANQLQKMSDEKFKEKIQKLYGVKVLAMKKFYWDCGTHYYRPLKDFNSREEFIDKVQNYEEDLYVVGELISQRQGWTQGALESVGRIIDQI